MAYGSLGQFLPLQDTETVISTPEPTPPSHRLQESRQRHRSLADVCSSVLNNYDNSTDSGLYRPRRSNVAHSLQLVDTSFTTPHKAKRTIKLPGYREIRSKVRSFRVKKKEIVEETDISKVRELEMRNEMLLAANHDVLRTMKRELRRIQADQPRTTLSDQFQARLQLRMHQLTHPNDHRSLWKCEGKKLFQKPQLLPSSEAYQRSQSVYTKRWSSAHGKRPLESTLDRTCKALFEMVDVQESGKIATDKLVWMLLALGIRLDPGPLVLSLSRYIGATDRLDLSQFTRYICDNTELVSAIQRLAPEDSSPRPLQNTPLIPYLDTHFCRLFQAWELIKSTWKALDPGQISKTETEKAAKQLVKLGLVVEIGAAQRLAKKLSGGSKWLAKDDFLSFFIRPLVKLHVEVVDKGVREWIKTEEMVSQRLAEVTRTVIMSGLLYKPERCRYAGTVIERLQAFDKEQYENYAEYREFIAAFLAPASKKASETSLKAEESHVFEQPTASTMPSDPSFHVSPRSPSKRSPVSPYIQRPKSTRVGRSSLWSEKPEKSRDTFALKAWEEARFSPDPVLGLFLA